MSVAGVVVLKYSNESNRMGPKVESRAPPTASERPLHRHKSPAQSEQGMWEEVVGAFLVALACCNAASRTFHGNNTHPTTLLHSFLVLEKLYQYHHPLLQPITQSIFQHGTIHPPAKLPPPYSPSH